MIELIIGPMFSGKSTELIKICNKYAISKYKCVLVKYSEDTRYDDNNVITHDMVKSRIKSIKTLRLSDIFDELIKYDVIGIDEGQFYEDINIIIRLANKIIIVAALDGTFEQKPFLNVINLIPQCEKVNKLNAICMKCYKDNAAFTKRITNEKELQIIGSCDKYISICRQCI